MALRAVAGSSGSSSLVVGTTTITGGAAGQLLYDSGGTLTESANLTFASNILNTSGGYSLNAQTYLASDGANILAQRNGTNANVFRVYNTYTNSTNYECGVLDWQTTTNVLTIGATAAGTGTQRTLTLVGNVINLGPQNNNKFVVSVQAISPTVNGSGTLGTSTLGFGQLFLAYTNSTTAGAQTINKSAGQFVIAAAATSVVITNSLVSANSQVFVSAATNDTTGRVNAVVTAAGSFTVYCTAPTSNMTINFLVVNA